MTDARAILAAHTAVRAALVAAIEQRITVEQAVARVVSRLFHDEPAETDRAERPSERLRRENETALAGMLSLETRGKSRQAALIVARRLAQNPRDPAELERLAQRFRRLRRQRK